MITLIETLGSMKPYDETKQGKGDRHSTYSGRTLKDNKPKPKSTPAAPDAKKEKKP